MSSGTNQLRMPFAEWLAKMADCGLAPAGRTVAVYAAAFDITSNGELARLTGIEGRSLDKWKRILSANGWVIIPPCVGGRGNGIEVIPAYREVPVQFTDLRRRKGSKYYPRNFEQTPAEIAVDLEPETPAIIAQTPAETAPLCETPANSAGVSSPAPARAEVSNIYNNINNLPNQKQNTLALSEQEAARDGEREIAPGLFLNCKTIRHRSFVIDVEAVRMQVFGKAIPDDRVLSFCEGSARQWASEIANGRPPSDVVPRAIARALSIGLTKEANFAEAHEHGMAMKAKASKPRVSRW